MVNSMFFLKKIAKFVLNYSVYTKKSKSSFIKFLSNVYGSRSNRSPLGRFLRCILPIIFIILTIYPWNRLLQIKNSKKSSTTIDYPQKTSNNPKNLQKSWQNHPNSKIPFFFSTSSVKTQIENDYYEIIISRIKQLISKLKQVIYEVIMIKRERSRGGNWLIV